MQTLVEVKSIEKSFDTPKGPVKVLDGVSFEVKKGQVIALLGPSGSGKSTCLRSLNALETIDKGEIIVCGRNYRESKLSAHVLRQKTAMVFQRFELFPHLSARENVALAMRLVKKINKTDSFKRADELLEQVGLKDHITKYPHSLSGGQQQRVGIARALACDPEVLLCDEPTSALDPELVGEVTDILQKVAESGMTMIIVTHEMSFARQVADTCIFLDGGKIIESNDAESFFKTPQHPRLQKFLTSVSH